MNVLIKKRRKVTTTKSFTNLGDSDRRVIRNPFEKTSRHCLTKADPSESDFCICNKIIANLSR